MPTSAMPNAGNTAPGRIPWPAAAVHERLDAGGVDRLGAVERDPQRRQVEAVGPLRRARPASTHEKFGPAVTVPPKAEIHSIQRTGAARKSWGAPSTRSAPVVIGMVSSPTRPMSW